MINWNNMDTLASYAALKAAEPVKLAAVMSGENGAERVKKYTVPMGCGMDFNFGARPVNDEILSIMSDFAREQQLPVQATSYMFPPLRRDSSLVGQNERMTPEEAANARAMADLLQNEPVWFVTQAARFRSFVPLEREPWKLQEPRGSGMRCRAGLCSLWVDWQGNFSNCGMYPSVHVGYEGVSFREQWDRVVRETAEIRYTAACFGCPNRPLCHPCIAMIHNECGSHEGRPEYMCRMNEALSRYYDQFLREHYPDILPPADIPQMSADICEI